MIEDNFLICPECNKKIQPINKDDTIATTVYCRHCKQYYSIMVGKGKLYNMQMVSIN